VGNETRPQPARAARRDLGRLGRAVGVPHQRRRLHRVHAARPPHCRRARSRRAPVPHRARDVLEHRERRDGDREPAKYPHRSLSHIPYGHFAAALAPIAGLSLVANVFLLWLVHRRALGGPFAAQIAAEKPVAYERWVWKAGLVTLGVLVAFVVGSPRHRRAPRRVGDAAHARRQPDAPLRARRLDPPRALHWALRRGRGRREGGIAEKLLRVVEPLHPESVWGLTVIAAIMSNLASNVPAVMVLKSLVPHLPHAGSAWLTLAMASTLAGNLTLPGSLATIIVVERAKGGRRSRSSISLKWGYPAGSSASRSARHGSRGAHRWRSCSLR